MIETIRTELAKRPSSAIALTFLGALLLSGCSDKSSPGPGYDISFPQCDRDSFPKARSFAIVGLNEGKAKSINPCFEKQLDWARGSTGDTTQPKASIYVNSGNPGKARAEVWPKTGSFQNEACAGEESIACSYQYGRSLTAWNIKKFHEIYGKENDAKPKDFPWYIDVEVRNSWQCNQNFPEQCTFDGAIPSTDGARSRNAAVLIGMVDEMEKMEIDKVGIYTDKFSWKAIVGNQGRNTSLAGLDVWVAGAKTEKQAAELCDQESFYGLGSIVLSQYNPDIQKFLDKNVICSTPNK